MPKRLLAVLTCLLVACSSGGAPSTTEEPDTAASETTAASPTTAAPATTMAPTTTSGGEASDDGGPAGTITMSNFAFSGTTSVKVGDTIELVNTDEAPHTFTAEDDSFDVSISAGGTATHTFEEAGEFSYFCAIHPSMTGVITVEG